jgi:hypothetical protein
MCDAEAIVKRSALYFSIVAIALFQSGLSKADEVFLSQANIGGVTTLLAHMSSLSTSSGTMIAAPVTVADLPSSASMTSAPKQNVSQLSQVGMNNNALISQVGTGNMALVSQEGRGNVAVVTQSSHSH